jgi:hypothetical protein
VASAYQTWHEHVVNMKMRVMLNKTVLRWRLLGLLVPFRRWRSRVGSHKWLLSTSGKVASRRQKLETSVVFGRWMEAVAKQNLLRTTDRRIICRLLHHIKARAFREWVEILSNGKRTKRVEWRIARTLCHRMIARRLCHRMTLRHGTGGRMRWSSRNGSSTWWRRLWGDERMRRYQFFFRCGQMLSKENAAVDKSIGLLLQCECRSVDLHLRLNFLSVGGG